MHFNYNKKKYNGELDMKKNGRSNLLTHTLIKIFNFYSKINIKNLLIIYYLFFLFIINVIIVY